MKKLPTAVKEEKGILTTIIGAALDQWEFLVWTGDGELESLVVVVGVRVGGATCLTTLFVATHLDVSCRPD